MIMTFTTRRTFPILKAVIGHILRCNTTKNNKFTSWLSLIGLHSYNELAGYNTLFAISLSCSLRYLNVEHIASITEHRMDPDRNKFEILKIWVPTHGVVNVYRKPGRIGGTGALEMRNARGDPY